MAYYSALIEKSRLYPVWLMGSWLRRTARRLLLSLGLIVALLIAASATAFGAWSQAVAGALLVVASGLLVVWLLELYFRFHFYPSVVTNQYDPRDYVTFTVGRILFGIGNNDDVTDRVCRSRTGRRILQRLGVSDQEIKIFRQSRQSVALPPLVPAGVVLTLAELMEGIFLHDQGWAKWLLSQGVTIEDYRGATTWVVHEIERSAAAERWWAPERLAEVTPLAADWSYGGTYILDRYSHTLMPLTVASATVGRRGPEVRALFAVLARSREANALVVGGSRESSLGLIWTMAGLMRRGECPPEVRGKRLVVLETALFGAGFKERTEFETKLIQVLNEAAAAGNVILVIDDLAGLLRLGNSLSASTAELLDPYLAGRVLQVVALADTAGFHSALATLPVVMQRFEKVTASDLSVEEALAGAELIVTELESQFPVWFTYQAVVLLAMAARNYFQTDLASDKVADLLTEVVAWSRAARLRVITKSTAEKFLAEKTHIPMGQATAEESERLLSLEEKLSSRVIGQPAAVRAIARAMRRGRAGIRNPERPLASFLFLGPTGVGKTETAKALAAEYFGESEALARFDMSEFQGADALGRLIGDGSRGEPGLLSTRVRELGYGVLLLDEFEKSHRDVRNLFLQILDEGFFSDAAGRRVNARNLIIIATSNAGAAQLWQLARDGKDVASARDELVSGIIAAGIFSPELLNRFDEVVVYAPLAPETLVAVAELQLKRLADRLYRNHGLVFEVTPELAAVVAKEGSTEAFGARPMQRFIQDKLEEQIASALIRGDIRSGSRLQFSHELALVF